MVACKSYLLHPHPWDWRDNCCYTLTCKKSAEPVFRGYRLSSLQNVQSVRNFFRKPPFSPPEVPKIQAVGTICQTFRQGVHFNQPTTKPPHPFAKIERRTQGNSAPTPVTHSHNGFANHPHRIKKERPPRSPFLGGLQKLSSSPTPMRSERQLLLHPYMKAGRTGLQG